MLKKLISTLFSGFFLIMTFFNVLPCKATNTPSKNLSQKRILYAEDFARKCENNQFKYLQEALCVHPNKKHLKKTYFKKSLKTPFGNVTVLFRWCKNQNRYIRFILRAGTYKNITKALDKKYSDSNTRKRIYKIILDYLTFYPSVNDVWCLEKVNFSQKLTDTTLANFCAILAVCDPCFGKNENGGKDVRAILRSNNCKTGCRFSKFIDPKFNPASQKGAYSAFRDCTEGKNTPATNTILEKTQELSDIITDSCDSEFNKTNSIALYNSSVKFNNELETPILNQRNSNEEEETKILFSPIKNRQKPIIFESI